MNKPAPINIVACESFSWATDDLYTRPSWKRIAEDRWTSPDGEEFRIVTRADRLRGTIVAKAIKIGILSQYFDCMIEARRARPEDFEYES